MIKIQCDQCQEPVDLFFRYGLVMPTGESLDFDTQEHMEAWLAANPYVPPVEDPPVDEPADDGSSLDPIPDENGVVYRDAVTGRYVTPEYAAAHPDTTVSETPDPT